MGYRRLNDSAALTALAALLTNLTEISSIFNATIATESPTVAPSAASTIDHSILDPHPEIIGIVYPPNIQDVKTDWHQLQSFKKRDFQDQNPPQTLDEFYAR